MGHSFLINLRQVRQDWLGNVRGDLLAGLVVALALIPEAIAFSIIAGVDPKVGLYASFSIAVLTAITGGRPGMISAATAATAVLMINLVKDHENGLQLLFSATILAGILQIIMGLLKLGNAMRFVSRSVLTGFVNALAILIFLAQLPEILPASVPDFMGAFLKATHIDHKVDMLWLTWGMIAGGLAIIYLLPRITTLIPSPLLCIIVLTTVSLAFKWDVRSVSDLGKLPDGLPFFMVPQVPLTFETLMIILPYSLAIAVVGLLESLMTTSIVDELTDTKGNKNQECIGQGIANTTTGFIGGMAGCAMIGQSVINVKSGGRGRLSCFAAGILLLIFVVPLSKWVGLIPMPALVAIMIMVSIGTFSWSSIGNLFRHPRSSSIVMLTVVGSVIFTHNLAIGVLIGVLLSGIFFASKIAQIFHVSSQSTDGGKNRIYTVTGQLFFASVEDFNNSFDFREALNKVTIDVSDAHIWDISSVQALDAVVLKFRREGANVQVIGLNKASKTIVDKLGEADKKNAMDRIAEH